MSRFVHSRRWAVASIALLLVGMSALAEEDTRAHPERTIRAVRATTAPVLDGLLDDDVWNVAPIATDFTQRQPDEGEPATEKTAVQFAFDDEALYIAVMCYDSEPDKIVSRLTRREDWADRDWVSVNLDPHHDHKTGFYFVVGPSGWQSDGILFDDGNESETWDGVWEAATEITDEGWSIEYRIPYHVLRFAERDEYTWGVFVHREVTRKNERSMWILHGSDDNGWTSRFGHLVGIEGISPPRHLEVLPFALGRVSLTQADDGGSRDTDLFGSTGLDVRYGLSSSVSLNATINPDFGQVEADPAVLNLSVFENFFRERRPFFVEGASVFSTPWVDIVGIGGPSTLFHSRRIGRRPGRFDIPDGAEELDRPDASTILGALKLSGKTQDGLSFGVLEALTAPEHARVSETASDGTTVERDHRIESLTNHFVGRVQQDVLKESKVGATMTAMNGEGFAPAYVGSVDGQHKWGDGGLTLFGRLAASRAGEFDDRKQGYEGALYFSKWSGWLGGQLYADATSRDFDTNDLGFMRRADRVQTGGHVSARIKQPWALARESGFNLNAWSHWNLDGDRLARGINFNNWHELKFYWWMHFGISRGFERLDDLATRGGPSMLLPADWEFFGSLGSDRRKIVTLRGHGNAGRSEAGLSKNARVGLDIGIKPASNLQVSLGPSLSSRSEHAQWVENLDANGDGEDDRFVFGELDQDVFELGARVSLAFTTTLSIQGYVQSFVTNGDYVAFRELARERSYDFTPVAQAELSENPDFSNRSLRGNMVLRWEYEPGSTLFVVWSQNRSASFDTGDPDFTPFSSAWDSFTDDGEDVFLVKLNYWLGL